MQLYQRRRMKSQFWHGVLQAWKSLGPGPLREPQTRDEVLREPIFESQWIKRQDGSSFAISGKGNFGRAWIERGVLRVEDIWDDQLPGWRTVESLRAKLGRLWHVQARRDELIQAIPEDWKKLLEGTHPIGRWYRHCLSIGRDLQVLKRVGEDKLEVWERQIKNGRISSELVFKEERVGGGVCLVEEVRVLLRFAVRGMVQLVILMDGVPIRCMRLDICRYGWPRCRGKPEIHQYTSKLGMGIQRQGGSSTVKIQEAHPHSTIGTELSVEYYKEMWKVSRRLPSKRCASVLWLIVHVTPLDGESLFIRGLEVEVRCVRCHCQPENFVHLWGTCPLSLRIWKWWAYHWKEMGGPDAVKWDLEWAVTGCLPPSLAYNRGWGYVAVAIRAVAIRWIWKEHNSVLFQKRYISDVALKSGMKSTVRQMITLDWRKKVLTRTGPEQDRARLWFLRSWAKKNRLAAVSAATGKLVLSSWLIGLNGRRTPDEA